LVGAHAEGVAPHLLLKGVADGAAVGEPLEPAGEVGLVVTGRLMLIGPEVPGGVPPGGMSEAIRVKPAGVARWACMTPSAGSPPMSPNVITVSSPPKTSR